MSTRITALSRTLPTCEQLPVSETGTGKRYVGRRGALQAASTLFAYSPPNLNRNGVVTFSFTLETMTPLRVSCR